MRESAVSAGDDAGPVLARPNRFEVDLDAVAHNASVIRRLVGQTPKIFAALKADAYGYGTLEVARTLLSSGVDALSLVSLQDAIILRRNGVSAPILLYAGVLPDSSVVEAVGRYDLMPTILDLESAATFSSLAAHELRVFVKIDVGLERLGIAPEAAVGSASASSQLVSFGELAGPGI